MPKQPALRWTHDDGGRAAAGFEGYVDDCVTRAIAIATQRPYREVYDLIAAHTDPETGVADGIYAPILRAFGWQSWWPQDRWSGLRVGAYDLPVTRFSRMIVSVRQVRSGFLAESEDGSTSKGRHLMAVVDKVARDNGGGINGTVWRDQVDGIWVPAGEIHG